MFSSQQITLQTMIVPTQKMGFSRIFFTLIYIVANGEI